MQPNVWYLGRSFLVNFVLNDPNWISLFISAQIISKVFQPFMNIFHGKMHLLIAVLRICADEHILSARLVSSYKTKYFEIDSQFCYSSVSLPKMFLWNFRKISKHTKEVVKCCRAVKIILVAKFPTIESFTNKDNFDSSDFVLDVLWVIKS